MTVKEENEKVSISFATYKKFFGNYYGWWFAICLQSALVLYILANTFNDYFIGNWAYQEDQYTRFWWYFGLSIAFCFAIALFTAMRASTSLGFTWRAGRKLHRDMVTHVLGAPINLYFDVTPTGRILNRFSKDLSAIESHMAGVVAWFFQLLYRLI